MFPPYTNGPSSGLYSGVLKPHLGSPVVPFTLFCGYGFPHKVTNPKGVPLLEYGYWATKPLIDNVLSLGPKGLRVCEWLVELLFGGAADRPSAARFSGRFRPNSPKPQTLDLNPKP